MKTRLLHVVPPWAFPGAEQQLLTLARHLDGESFQQHALLLGKQIALAKELFDSKVEIRHAGQPTRWHIADARRIKTDIASINPDLIHIWDAPRQPAHWWAALQMRVPVVASDSPTGLPLNAFQSLAKTGLLMRTHGFVIPELPGKKESVDNKFDAIPLGLDCVQSDETDSSVKDAVDLRQQLGIPSGSRIAVAINPLIPVAGLKDAIWSSDLIKCVRDDFHVLILGEGPQRWRLDRFRQQTRTGDRVHFVKDIGAAELLSHADVLWQTPRLDTDWTIVLLAMTLGVPVIATDLHAHRRLIVDGETGYLIPPGNRAHLARRTQLLLNDDSLLERMQIASRQRAKDHFSSEGMISGYQRLYQSCLRI